MNTSKNVREIVVYSLLVAIVFVATYIIQIHVPFLGNGGLIHAGNIALFSIAMLFGPKKGAVAGAFGMALFDLLSPWVIWAPGTFVIRGVMGFIIGYIFYAHSSPFDNFVLKVIVAAIISSIWMIGGYYLYQVLLYGDWLAPLNSVIGDITQIAIGWAGAVPLYLALKNFSYFDRGAFNE